MGLLGGQLKRLELLSARLGDVLSALYLAAACVWRYEVEADAAMLPLARAAIRRAAGARRGDRCASCTPTCRRARCAGCRRCCSAAPRALRALDDRTLLALADALRERSGADRRAVPRRRPAGAAAACST